MHDPMVVAWEVPFPLPRRKRWRDAKPGEYRWGTRRRRRTNPENLGQPVWPWWRLRGWEPFRLAGRAFDWRRLCIIWHVEPHERDAFEVCNRTSLWRWHVWHWRIQIPLLQSWRARLFDRCAECGRKGSPNVSHGWDSNRLGWRKWRSREDLYHRECSSLVTLRRKRTTLEESYRRVLQRLLVALDWSEEDLLAELHQRPARPDGYGIAADGHVVADILGWKFDQDAGGYELVRDDGQRVRPYDHALPSGQAVKL
jgi:hypothetical protein